MAGGGGRRWLSGGGREESDDVYVFGVDMAYPMCWIQRIEVFLEKGPRLISFRIFTYYISNTAYWSSGYGVLIMFPLWSLVSAGTDTSYLP
ncbi:hypothetical protein Tco_0385349 [Tanacetum coccineum]